ncbi:MAG TPA: YggS family pyridoxal phosphate-dependent enzyme [Ktedonobacterales bacterium]|nr:YggS family pyridoxal phosphate-dependent enzyme [Ktedonobacterales bacterium]
MTLKENARLLRKRVAAAAQRAGRQSEDVRVIAVTKTVPVETLRAAHALGFTIFGENRVQEAEEKIAALRELDLRWELIGHLQTNKAARALQLFNRIQSLDSLRLTETLNARGRENSWVVPVLLEVNVAGEPSKTGFAPEELREAARVVADCGWLRAEGLMTVAPLTTDPEAARPHFRRLRELRDELAEQAPLAQGEWRELSMGMTDDFEVAIEEGATIIRVGRALFGERPLA